jgi:hypothetical protein
MSASNTRPPRIHYPDLPAAIELLRKARTALIAAAEVFPVHALNERDATHHALADVRKALAGLLEIEDASP